MSVNVITSSLSRGLRARGYGCRRRAGPVDRGGLDQLVPLQQRAAAGRVLAALLPSLRGGGAEVSRPPESEPAHAHLARPATQGHSHRATP